MNVLIPTCAAEWCQADPFEPKNRKICRPTEETFQFDLYVNAFFTSFDD